MSIRMTHDEVKMIESVIRTSSNCPRASVKGCEDKYGDSAYKIIIPSKDNSHNAAELMLETFVPDVAEADMGMNAAAKMLMFMNIESFPQRAATFLDYIAMTYEFGKQHRWI